MLKLYYIYSLVVFDYVFCIGNYLGKNSPIKHVQMAISEAEFVLFVQPTGEYRLENNDVVAFKVHVLKVIKDTSKDFHSGSYIELYSDRNLKQDLYSCATFSSNHSYYITGKNSNGKPFIDVNEYVEREDQLAYVHKKGFEEGFSVCEVKFEKSSHDNNEDSGNACFIDLVSDDLPCYYKYGICERFTNIIVYLKHIKIYTPFYKCQWEKNVMFENCVKEIEGGFITPSNVFSPTIKDKTLVQTYCDANFAVIAKYRHTIFNKDSSNGIKVAVDILNIFKEYNTEIYEGGIVFDIGAEERLKEFTSYHNSYYITGIIEEGVPHVNNNSSMKDYHNVTLDEMNGFYGAYNSFCNDYCLPIVLPLRERFRDRIYFD